MILITEQPSIRKLACVTPPAHSKPDPKYESPSPEIAPKTSSDQPESPASRATPGSHDKSCTPPPTTNLPVLEKLALEQTPVIDVLETHSSHALSH
jgi:hypothetical protein